MPELDDVPTSTGANESATPVVETPAPEPSLREELAAELSKALQPPAEETPQQEEVREAAQGRVRDPATGKFISKQQTAAPSAEPKPTEQQQPAETQPLAPPPGFSATAKAEWAKVPDAVKQAIANRESEVNNGFKKYAGLDQYVQMANQSGTTLPEAIKRYVAAEDFLEKDPLNGILWLCKNYGLEPQQLVEAVSGGQQPQAPQQNGQQAHQQFDPRPLLQPLDTRLSRLEQALLRDETSRVMKEVDLFFGDTKNHPYAENVAPQMAKLLQLKVCSDLEEAYRFACRTSDEIFNLTINEATNKQTADQAEKARQVASQARQAGQSITGGPQSTPPSSAPQSDNLRDQLKEAFASRA